MVRLLMALAILGLGCGHAKLTTITTRTNGTIKFCGNVDQRDPVLVKGKTPEGSRVAINRADIVTIEENGVCRK